MCTANIEMLNIVMPSKIGLKMLFLSSADLGSTKIRDVIGLRHIKFTKNSHTFFVVFIDRQNTHWSLVLYA